MEMVKEQEEEFRYCKIIHITDNPPIEPTGECQLSIILCLALEDDGQRDTMPKDVVELIHSFQVYKYAATTKEEWEEQCKLWPTSYHPPTYNIDGINGFSKEASLSVLGFMTQAITLAKSGNHQMVNAAVIVDPSANQVIATACDQVSPKNDFSCNSNMGNHLPRYSNVMIQLNASKLEGSHSLTGDCSPSDRKHLPDGVGCVHPWKWAQEQLNASSGDWHPLKHAAIVAIEHAAARDRVLYPTSGHSKESFIKDDIISFPVGSPSKKQKIGLEKVHGEENQDVNGVDSHCDFSRPYLCTGYDIYLVWEPCAMCAMALVHQRVKRIFYAFPNSSSGALGGVHRLQGEKSLNQHYAVFRVMLTEGETLGDMLH